MTMPSGDWKEEDVVRLLVTVATAFGDLMFAFVTDPDGNQIELIMSP